MTPLQPGVETPGLVRYEKGRVPQGRQSVAPEGAHIICGTAYPVLPYWAEEVASRLAAGLCTAVAPAWQRDCIGQCSAVTTPQVLPLPTTAGPSTPATKRRLPPVGMTIWVGLRSPAKSEMRTAYGAKTYGVRSTAYGQQHTANSVQREVPYSFVFRNRSAFVMTDTELKLMAAAAMMGLSRIPNFGYSTPAAIGTPTEL